MPHPRNPPKLLLALLLSVAPRAAQTPAEAPPLQATLAIRADEPGPTINRNLYSGRR